MTKNKIFSPYYRPELAWKIDSAGHGLGLAVVARCAKLMNVTYGMQSIEDKGSRFWMRFQQHQGESKALDPTPAIDAVVPVTRRIATGKLSCG
jgi:K+-sensing histidine kinase KdpD